MASKRLIKELQQYQKEPSTALIALEPVSEDDLLHLRATLKGPAGTAYDGGLFDLAISIPASYPNVPPEVKFLTPCCHPNVDFDSGEICLDLLKTSWTPAYTVKSTLEAIQQLLEAGGEIDSPLNIDLARLIREGDIIGAEGLIRFCTWQYAMRR